MSSLDIERVQQQASTQGSRNMTVLEDSPGCGLAGTDIATVQPHAPGAQQGCNSVVDTSLGIPHGSRTIQSWIVPCHDNTLCIPGVCPDRTGALSFAKGCALRTSGTDLGYYRNQSMAFRRNTHTHLSPSLYICMTQFRTPDHVIDVGGGLAEGACMYVCMYNRAARNPELLTRD